MTPPLNDDIRRALVVDDNELNSRLAGLMLNRQGWQSWTARSGREALETLRTQSFDLVLLDLRMPGISGEQVCRHIREEMGLIDLPVIAYTAHSMPEEKARILASGFNGLLIKPISYQDLKEICDAVDCPAV